MNPHTPEPARIRRSKATVGLLAVSLPVLLLSACSTEGGRGIRAGDWTSAVGVRWDAFVDGTLAPLTDTGIAIIVTWLVLAVAARVVTLLPPVRDLRLERRTGRRFCGVGWLLVVCTPIATVLVTAFARDALVAWLLVGGILGTVAVGLLAPGLATRSRLDAQVIGPDGSTNGAWSIDALLQVRNLNSDDPGQRVERQNSPDFGEFITIADRSGSGIASMAAWLMQVLFNSSPWMLQVTIVDGRSAIATLRRNGLSLDEEHLELETGAASADQHRKLLAMAAAFTAMTMADRYPDVRGFYGATNWRSLGYLAVAQIADDDRERDLYVDRAVELEPRSLLVEYRGMYLGLEESCDRESLEHLMDELEPVVNQAAWVCRKPLVFPEATPRDWHEFRLPMRPEAEPSMMLLRTLMLYGFAARNWAALVDLQPGSDPSASGRRERIGAAVDRLVPILDEASAAQATLTRLEALATAIRCTLRSDSRSARRDWEDRELRRRDPAGVLTRMRARAALCYVIFHEHDEHAEALAVAAVPTEGPTTDAAARRLARPARSGRRSSASTETAAIVQRWLEETRSSPEIESRYSYACYLARRASAPRTRANRAISHGERIGRSTRARMLGSEPSSFSSGSHSAMAR